MEVKVKRLTETAIMPTKAHPTDACFDLYTDEDAVIEPGKSVAMHTGITTEIPNGFFAAVFPRSGMGIKRHLRLSNSTGIIDSDYRGEWVVALHNDGDETQVINKGDRVAQFAILPVLDAKLIESELTETERGTGGLGSTGN